MAANLWQDIDGRATLDPERPWPGLFPYTEEAEQYFFGRREEIKELLDRVRREPLTILFGGSGLGKTSLLQVGLFRQAQSGDLPILIRLKFPEQGQPAESLNLGEQVRSALKAAVKDLDKALADYCDEVEELWEAFHNVERGFLKAGAPRVVLVFDQFEELFTKGEDGEYGDKVHAFMSELAGLVENEPSSDLSRRINRDESLIDRFDRYRQPFRMILSLRDDFLGRLERYRHEIPLMMKSRMELLPLNGKKAYEAVFEPARLRGIGSELLNEAVAEMVVCQVAKAPEKTPMSEIKSVHSAHLSVLCWGLNKRRIEAGEKFITADSVRDSSDQIIEEFYRSGFKDLNPAIQRYVEKRLVSQAGYRESLLRDTAEHDLRDLGIVNPKRELDELIYQRILGVDYHGGLNRIELAHDVLTKAAMASREQEEIRINKDRQTRELDEMTERMKQEWRSPTVTARPLVEDYYRKLAETDQFDIFGEQSAIALTLAANNLLYVHGDIREGLSASEKALKILASPELKATETAQMSSRKKAAALCAYAKGLLETGRFKEANTFFKKALNCLNAPEALPTLSWEWDDPFFIRILALMGIGDGLGRRGYRGLAIKRYDQALAQLSIGEGSADPVLQERIAFYQAIILLAKSYYSTSNGFAQGCQRECDRILKKLTKIQESREWSQKGRRDLSNEASANAYIEYLSARLAWGKGDLFCNLKNGREALRHLEEASERCRELLRRDSENWRWCALNALIYWSLGRTYLELYGDQDEAQKLFLEMEKVVEKALGEQQPGDLSREQADDSSGEQVEKARQKIKQPEFLEIRYMRVLARTYLARAGSSDERLDQKAILNDLKELDKEAPGYATCERSIALTNGYIGDSLLNANPNEALNHFEEALGFISQKPKKIRNTPPFQEVALWLQNQKGEVLRKLSQLDKAINSFRRATEIAEELAKSEPVVSRYLPIADDYAALAESYLESGDLDKAISSYELATQACDREPSSVELMDKKGSIYLAACQKWKERSDLTQWYDALEKAAAVLQEAFKLDPVNYGLCKQLEKVHKNSESLRKALDSEVASEIGFEKLNEMRNKVMEIEKGTEYLLYPRHWKLSEGMLHVSEPQNWSVRPLIEGSWITLVQREQDEEVERLKGLYSLSSEEKSLSQKILRIRKLRLPCYDDVDLFETEVLWQGSMPLIWAYLRATDGTVILNGTSPPIHAFNEKHRLRLETSVQAATYFRFFCGAIAGKTTFRIVDTAADVAWLPGVATEKIQNFQRIIYPLRLKQEPNGDWSARCTMVHDTEAFYVLMKLPRSGKIQMDIDNKITRDIDIRITRTLPVLAEYYLRGFRFFAPFRSEETAQANAPEELSGQGQATDPQIKSVSDADQ